MEAQFSASLDAAPDAFSAAAHYVEREYGYGYRMGLAARFGAIAVFEVRHGDGSAFNVIADRWGNVQRVPDDASVEDARRQIERMHEAAVTP